MAASKVLLQFRLDDVLNSTLRLNHSSPEANYIRTVDFDHRKQLVCWVRNPLRLNVDENESALCIVIIKLSQEEAFII